MREESLPRCLRNLPGLRLCRCSCRLMICPRAPKTRHLSFHHQELLLGQQRNQILRRAMELLSLKTLSIHPEWKLA